METNDKDIAISNNNKDITCAGFEAASTIASTVGNTVSTVTNSLKEIGIAVLECKRNYDNIQQTLQLSKDKLEKLDKNRPIIEENLKNINNTIHDKMQLLNTLSKKEMTEEDHKSFRMLVQGIVQLSGDIVHLAEQLD